MTLDEFLDEFRVAQLARNTNKIFGAVSLTMIERLFQFQDGRCFYCSKKVFITKIPYKQLPVELHDHIATREHLIPRSRKGANGHENMVMACTECNLYRGTLDLSVWFTCPENGIEGERVKFLRQAKLERRTLYHAE